MADEIRYSIRLQCTNGDYSGDFAKQNKVADQAAQGAASGIQVIGDTTEALYGGDLSTEGILCLANLDTVAYVTFGPYISGAQMTCGRLKPGESAMFRAEPNVQMNMTAQSGTVKVQYLWLED